MAAFLCPVCSSVQLVLAVFALETEVIKKKHSKIQAHGTLNLLILGHILEGQSLHQGKSNS